MGATRSELLRKRLEAFTRALPAVEQGDVKALHRARVASRRLREVVPLLELERADAHKIAKRLRKVTSRLGTIRELDVLLLLIDELHVSRREHASALGRVAMEVARDRDAMRKRSIERLQLDELGKIARKLWRSADRLGKQPPEPARTAEHPAPSRAWRWAADARVARRAARLAAAMEEAGAVYVPERLHAVRIAVKKLRYALELAGDARAQRDRPELRTLRRAQNLLGRMHDLQVLIDRVRQVQASLMPPSVDAWRGLDALNTALDDECRRLHGRYMRRRPELDAIAARLSARRMPPAAQTPPRSRTASVRTPRVARIS